MFEVDIGRGGHISVHFMPVNAELLRVWRMVDTAKVLTTWFLLPCSCMRVCRDLMWSMMSSDTATARSVWVTPGMVWSLLK